MIHEIAWEILPVSCRQKVEEQRVSPVDAGPSGPAWRLGLRSAGCHGCVHLEFSLLLSVTAGACFSFRTCLGLLSLLKWTLHQIVKQIVSFCRNADSVVCSVKPFWYTRGACVSIRCRRSSILK